MHPDQDPRASAFLRLLEVMDELRIQCPWDAKQTMESIRHLSIEEVFELSEAIVANKPELILEEVGDVLLHVVFYARIAQDNEWFNIEDVIHNLVQKLIRRHPHIYGDAKVRNSQEVAKNWEQIKQSEKKKSAQNNGYLSGVPAALPALIKSLRMQEKASQAGFDWDNKEEVLLKVKEEWNEFFEAQSAQNKEEEFGDLLFSLINYARHENLNPDLALERANQKFKRRFEAMEKMAKTHALSLNELSLEKWDELWNEVKKSESNS